MLRYFGNAKKQKPYLVIYDVVARKKSTSQKRRMKEAQLSQTVVRRLIFVHIIFLQPILVPFTWGKAEWQWKSNFSLRNTQIYLIGIVPKSRLRSLKSNWNSEITGIVDEAFWANNVSEIIQNSLVFFAPTYTSK